MKPTSFKWSGAHVFSIFESTIKLNDEHISLTDKPTIHRISNVLRLNVKDDLILFNNSSFCYVSIVHLKSKEILFEKKSKLFEIKKPNPKINFYISLLKKESMESICNSCSMFGINEIIPVLTKKVQRTWGGEKERNRLTNILISGCEQSKNYMIPQLHDPIPFDQFIQLNNENEKIFFDIYGNQTIIQMIQRVKFNQSESLDVFIGPEGDLTELEHSKLKHFNRVKLSENILTSTHASILGLGILRSLN
jgi:16S rRNA (uracil1498-N3)-methyltransferase